MQQPVTFITGNQSKAEYLAKYLGFPVEHQKVELEEIQSMDLRAITEYKAKQAYAVAQKPVLVEDMSLEFSALGRLPGPFIKFFLEEMSYADLCALLDSKDRSAIAKCVYGYYDGSQFTAFETNVPGRIANAPTGENGYGWDKIFIPEGYDITRAQMDDDDYKTTYLMIKPLEAVKQFLLHE